MAILDFSRMKFSVVIPTYQETARLGQTLGEIMTFLAKNFPQFEIIVVDDPARDGSYTQILAPYNQDPRIRLLHQPVRWGKGTALRRGLLESEGEIVLFMDADHATPIQEVLHFIEQVKSVHAPIVVGGVRAYQEDESKGRRIIGICAQLLFHVIVFTKAVPDSQCGFKLFTRKTIDLIIPYCRVSGGIIDVEIFFLAQKFGVPCRFEPVRWVNKTGSKVSILKCSIRDIAEVFKIRLRSIFKGYCKPFQLAQQPWATIQKMLSIHCA